MPLPLVPIILGGLSFAAGALGIKKGSDAKKNYDLAKDIVNEAAIDLDVAKERLENSRKKTGELLAELGKLRLEVESVHMVRFVNLVKEVHQTAYRPIELGGTDVLISLPDLREMQASSYRAADLVKDGIEAISSGVLIGVGTSGLASSVGIVAGTGTAIGSLTGVAATNATLAWLGGGSLAAGGMGMAGGTAILGGAIAGPALAVMGYVAAAKSEKALTDAYSKESEIREHIEQVKNGISLLQSIRLGASEVESVVLKLRDYFDTLLITCEQMIDAKKVLRQDIQENWRAANVFLRIYRKIFKVQPKDPLSFSEFSQQEKDIYVKLNLFGFALYKVIKVKLLNEDGEITTEGKQVVADTKELLISKEQS